MATSKIEIIQRAASATGNGWIASLDGAGDVATIADAHYEAIAEELLTAHSWKFARKAEALSRLSDEAEAPWGSLWQRPPLLLSLQYVCTDGGIRVEVEPRDVASGQALAVLGEPTALYAVGTYRVAEDRWPAPFAFVMQKRLEAVYLSGIAEQRSAADACIAEAEMRLRKERVREQRESTASDPKEWDLTRARHRSGAWSRFRR